MGALLQFNFEFVTETCCRDGCGIQFAMPKYFQAQLLKDHSRSFYCPNGHSQYYVGKTELQLAKEETERVRQQLKWAEENAASASKARDKADRRASAAKGVVTKIKRRVGNGVCPCCNRTFQNLMAHMNTKHPKFKGKK